MTTRTVLAAVLSAPIAIGATAALAQSDAAQAASERLEPYRELPNSHATP